MTQARRTRMFLHQDSDVLEINPDAYSSQEAGGNSLDALLALAARQAQDDVTGDGIFGLRFVMQRSDGSCLAGTITTADNDGQSGMKRCGRLLAELHAREKVIHAAYYMDTTEGWLQSTGDEIRMWGISGQAAVIHEFSIRRLRVDITRTPARAVAGYGRVVETAKLALAQG